MKRFWKTAEVAEHEDGWSVELDGRPVTIWRARVEDGRLVPLEVQPAGRRRMTYDEFRRGLRA